MHWKKKKRDEVEERLRANATSVFPNVIIKVDFNTIFQIRREKSLGKKNLFRIEVLMEILTYFYSTVAGRSVLHSDRNKMKSDR